jgi:hypothetical protein
MEYGELNLSLLKNPELVFKNTIGATQEGINMPITYKDYAVGVVIDVTEKEIRCKIWDKFVRFYPEYNSKDGIDEFKLFGINISMPLEEITKQILTEDFVAVEMYKQFMKDNMTECAKVRKQILKKQEVDYFKKSNSDSIKTVEELENLFNKCISTLVSEDYKTGYLEALNHVKEKIQIN